MTINSNHPDLVEPEQGRTEPAPTAFDIDVADDDSTGFPSHGSFEERIDDVDTMIESLGDLDPAEAGGPSGRIAEILGVALDREDR